MVDEHSFDELQTSRDISITEVKKGMLEMPEMIAFLDDRLRLYDTGSNNSQ